MCFSTESEVSESVIPLPKDKDIIWFDISVDESMFLMYILKGLSNLSEGYFDGCEVILLGIFDQVVEEITLSLR